ncbi:MAG: phosphatidylinositol kinase [Bacteroidetes bacterium]|nr:MAG: phosphatidylinositol kinase [Bacteroidota bacterium]PIE88613.1 MAG: phosphatidylinositol kinase [Bacteroidota bacterium]
MRTAKVFYKNEQAGVLTQKDDGSFLFEYLDDWVLDTQKPAISLTFPKSEKVFFAETLFPFFYHLLPEGVNKKFVCRTYKIDASDAFGILLNTAKTDTIGAVTIEKIP